ncbi:MAG: sensor histidine kinase [Rhizobiaceae bacterium]|nr:sensor histidine kinase [Rhizobiaceae bacterium]
MSGEGFRYPVFILDPSEIDDAEIYLRIKTASSMQGLVWLSDFQSFFGLYDAETMTLSVLIGVMCAILIYILALGLLMRSHTNLFLAGCIASGLLYIVCSNAFLETLLVPGTSTVSRVLALTSTLLIYCSFTGFMSSFLRLHRHRPRLFVIARVWVVLLAIAASLAVVDDLLAIGVLRHLSAYLGLATIALALFAALASALRTWGRAMVFVLAWMPSLVAGSARLVLDVTPQVGVTPAIENSLLFGITASLVLFTIIASIDIQKRETRLKAEILDNADRFRAFAEIGTDIFWEVDRRGKLVFFTGEQVGKASFTIGEVFFDRLSESTSVDFVRPLREAVAGRQPFDDRRLRMADVERDLWISLSGRAVVQQNVKTPDGQAVYRGLIRDVTTEVERESRRLLEQQMFALGQLAGSVAHEINNLIHPIINLTKRLRMRNRHTVDPESNRMMDLIDISSRQAATVVSELLQSTRGERWKDADRPLSTAVEHGVEAVRPALPSSVRVDLVVEPCEAINVKVGDILQIIGNLLSNAVHAMHGAGTITVSLSRAEDGAHLAIVDDGAGMDETVRRRAMQPFFSTKVDGRGTGVGLYIVQRIVREYGGFITLDSTPGHGTTVTIFFPNRKDDQDDVERNAHRAGGG